MKPGDLVMFTDEGRYAKWFWGQYGIVEVARSASKSCRVQWLQPVPYFESESTFSDFPKAWFEVHP